MTETTLGMPVVMSDALPDSIPFVLVLGHFNDYQMRMKATIKPEASEPAIMREKDTAQVGVNSVIERFEELLAAHPELTRGQAYLQAVMEAGEEWITGEPVTMENNDDRD